VPETTAAVNTENPSTLERTNVVSEIQEALNLGFSSEDCFESSA